MLKVIDLVYYSHNDYDKPQQVLERHAPALGFAPFIKDRIDIQFVKHLDYEGIEKIDGIQYAFFKSRNRFWHIPFKTHRYVKSQQPDIVVVEGLIFPLQLMMLKFTLGKKTKIIAQHHGEKPFKGIKSFFQKLADRYITSYLFTSNNNAVEWIDKKIINGPAKCMEVLEASTYFTKQDKAISRERCGMKGTYNFLWVGSLDENKDPLTVIKAFEKFIENERTASLYMIYQQNDLLTAIKKRLEQSVQLNKQVILIGKVDHHELPHWYNAADFYLSASHKEGSGYALLEAMACGCIPIVTNIPSFRKITAYGKYGFLFSPGNEYALAVILNDVKNINAQEFSGNVQKHFNERLSFKNIADDLYRIFNAIAIQQNANFTK